MRILIDADGCPVVDLAVQAARIQKVACLILADTAHFFEKEGATTITVSKGADSVDFALVNLVETGDIVITQDYGLAAMCLAKRGIPLSQNGMIYDNQNIDALLQARHAARKIRQGGGRLKGLKKRTAEQDRQFLETLNRLIAADRADQNRNSLFSMNHCKDSTNQKGPAG